MKKITCTLVLVWLHLQVNAQQEPISAFLEKWENSKNYLLAVAEAMPETYYNYKPTKEQMSFAQQLQHIQGNMNWLGKTYFSGNPPQTSKHIPKKQELLKNITASFDAVYSAVKNIPEKELASTVDFFAGPKTKLQILNLLQDHVSHHRGQLIVYLNLKGVSPPNYVGW